MAATGQVLETNAGTLGCGPRVIGPLNLRRQRSRADILAGFSGVVGRRGRGWPGAAWLANRNRAIPLGRAVAFGSRNMPFPSPDS